MQSALSSDVVSLAPVSAAFIDPRRYAAQSRRTARRFRALTRGRLGCTAMSEVLEHALRQSESQRQQLVRDIKIHHVTKRRLLEQGERFRTTLSTIGDAVVATDVDTRITCLNAVADALSGPTAVDARDHRLQADRPEAQAEVDATLVRITNAVTRFDRDSRVGSVYAQFKCMGQRSGTRGTR